MAIDVDSPFERLKKHEPEASVKFYNLRKPEGKKQFGYRLHFMKDIDIVPNTRYPNPDGTPKQELVAKVKFDKVWNDDEVKEGDVNRINLSRHATCESWFKENFEKIQSADGTVTGYKAEGMKVDIMIQGKVKGKKNSYWGYAILLAEDELSLVDAAMILFDGFEA